MGNLKDIFPILTNDLKNRPLTPKYSTGLNQLDEILWGIHKKELLIIAARPSQGKTSLALQIAFNLAESVNVLFISLEMSKEQLLERIINFSCHIDNYRTRRGLLSEHDWEKINSVTDYLSNLNIYIVDNIGAKIHETENLIKSLKPEFVFLDYIQMLYVDPRQNKVIAIEDFIKELKMLSLKHNFGAVVASQINRSPQERRDKRPMLSDLKGSGAIEEAADTVCLCYWEWQDTKKRKGDKNYYEVNIAKQRHGATGEVILSIEPEYFKFV